MSRIEAMSRNQRSEARSNLEYSLSFKNRLEAPVWLRVWLHEVLGNEEPISGVRVAETRAKAMVTA